MGGGGGGGGQGLEYWGAKGGQIPSRHMSINRITCIDICKQGFNRKTAPHAHGHLHF